MNTLWENESRLIGGHWEIPIPWRSKTSTLMNNYNQAKSKLMSLQKKLKNNLQIKEYDRVVQTLIDEGYAELISGHEEHVRSWYLPHHGVLKKYGTICMVFDCASRYRGSSLNDAEY